MCVSEEDMIFKALSLKHAGYTISIFIICVLNRVSYCAGNGKVGGEWSTFVLPTIILFRNKPL